MKFAKAISRKFFESFWFFALKRKEHICRKPRDGQRELALFSVSRLAAQNDVKFAQTHSAKSFAALFQKRPAGGTFLFDKSKFEKGGYFFPFCHIVIKKQKGRVGT